MTKEGNKKKRKKAGHRSWAPQNAPVKGKHKGDIMSQEKRSALMSRIKAKDTGPEKVLIGMLKKRGLAFHTHVPNLPGRPDIVFKNEKIVVFVEGDFWHGWRFPLWKHKLSVKWQKKIANTRARDQRNFSKLRRDDCKVIRIWEHQIEADLEKCISKILNALE